MRQRALSTWLTLLSVILGVALAVAVLILRRESEGIFGQKDYGYDLIVGPKGSPMQLVLNTVYHIDRSPGNIQYIVYEALRNNRQMVRVAIPYAVGDTYKGYRIAGTSPELFGFNDDGTPFEGYDAQGRLLSGYESPSVRDDDRDSDKKLAKETFEYRLGRKFHIAQGRPFTARKFEAVIGSDIPARTGLKIGDKFKATHDQPASGAPSPEDEHDEQWTVVGVLEPTHTAEDRMIFIPLVSFYAIPVHENAMEIEAAIKAGEDLSQIGKKRPATATAPVKKEDHDHDDDHDADHKHDHKPAATTASTTRPASAPAHAHEDHEEPYTLAPDGTINLLLPKDKWMLSAVLVKSRAGIFTQQMQYSFSKGTAAQGANPATVMREFFDTFLSPTTTVLLAISILVMITAAVSILVSIYNAVSARSREIAIMRALGATRGKILTLICLEAGLIGVLGGIIGLVVGHLIGAVESVFFARKLGVGINWLAPGWEEWVYLAGVAVLATFAGLVPGLKAYRTPVATNLVAA
jgi:putative ABC transport system permease protein